MLTLFKFNLISLFLFIENYWWIRLSLFVDYYFKFVLSIPLIYLFIFFTLCVWAALANIDYEYRCCRQTELITPLTPIPLWGVMVWGRLQKISPGLWKRFPDEAKYFRRTIRFTLERDGHDESCPLTPSSLNSKTYDNIIWRASPLSGYRSEGKLICLINLRNVPTKLIYI